MGQHMKKYSVNYDGIKSKLTATTAATTLTTASSEASAFTFAGHDCNVLLVGGGIHQPRLNEK